VAFSRAAIEATTLVRRGQDELIALKMLTATAANTWESFWALRLRRY
jgi:hypothetical protein